MEKGKESNGFFDMNAIFKKAYDQKFVKFYSEDIPRMLEDYKSMNKDILELKRRNEDLECKVKLDEERFLKLYIERIPQMLESSKINNKDISELKRRNEEFSKKIEEIEDENKQLKENGCNPIRQHTKMHKFVYGIISIFVTSAGFFFMWYFGR